MDDNQFRIGLRRFALLKSGSVRHQNGVALLQQLIRRSHVGHGTQASVCRICKDSAFLQPQRQRVIGIGFDRDRRHECDIAFVQ